MFIYTPRGRAREYSPLALNVYTGCDHFCQYCYGRRFGQVADNKIPVPRKDFFKKGVIDLSPLRKELENQPQIKEQVLLSFLGDTYCNANKEYDLTRKVLLLLAEFEVPVAILSKGGTAALPDIELFKEYPAPFKYGASLTFLDEKKSVKYEPGAALPDDRIAMLAMCKNEGIHTWASFEPVVEYEESIAVMKAAMQYVDEFRVGRLNHDKKANLIPWPAFGMEVVTMLRDAGKPFYIKEDLAKALPAGTLEPHECDCNYLNLKAE